VDEMNETTIIIRILLFIEGLAIFFVAVGGCIYMGFFGFPLRPVVP
jgi:hypothetical protein